MFLVPAGRVLLPLNLQGFARGILPGRGGLHAGLRLRGVRPPGAGQARSGRVILGLPCSASPPPIIPGRGAALRGLACRGERPSRAIGRGRGSGRGPRAGSLTSTDPAAHRERPASRRVAPRAMPAVPFAGGALHRPGAVASPASRGPNTRSRPCSPAAGRTGPGGPPPPLARRRLDDPRRPGRPDPAHRRGERDRPGDRGAPWPVGEWRRAGRRGG